MDLVDIRPELPRLTRLVRAFILAAIEGLSVGIGVCSIAQSSRLTQFVLTNRIAPGLRKDMLTLVGLPALLLPLLIAGSCAAPKLVGIRLKSLERRVLLLTPLCAAGFVPLVFQPQIWGDKPLAFLFTTAIFSIVVATTVFASLNAPSISRIPVSNGHFRSMWEAITSRIPAKAISLGATGLILLLAGIGIVHAAENMSIAQAGIGGEWQILRHFSEIGGVSSWFSLKGLRATGHASWLGVVFAVVSWLWPKMEGLLTLRVTTVALAAVPLFYWCKKALGPYSGLLISLAYLSMPRLGMLGAKDTFPITYAAGCFFLAACFFEKGKLSRAIPLVILSVAINEQVAIWYALLGMYLITYSANKVVGKILAITSACYFLAVALFLLPYYGIKTYTIDPTGAGSVGIQNLGVTLDALITNPVYALSRWFEVQSLEFWLTLLVPFAFLPIRSTRWLIWLAPALLLAGIAGGAELNPQWRDPAFGHFVVLGILASIVSLKQMRQSPNGGALQYRAALVGWLAAVLPCVMMFGSLWHRTS